MTNNWKIDKLKNVLTELESGKRPKGGVNGIEAGVPSIGAEHLNYNGSFKFEKIKFVPKEFAEKMVKGVIKENDIIVVKDGATTGKTSFVGIDFPYKFAVVNEHVFIIRVNNELIPKYVFYKLFSSTGKKEILKDFRGAAQGGISSSFVNNVNIPIPPLFEQQLIVSKIEQLLSELENGKQQLQIAQQQLKVYRQSLLKWAFEGKLTRNWRIKQEQLITSKFFKDELFKSRELEFNQKIEKWKKLKNKSVNEKLTKPQKPSNLDTKNTLHEGLIEKESIPLEWELVPLVSVSDNLPNSIVDGPFGSSINVNEDYVDSGIPVIRMVNIRPFTFVQDQMKFIKENKFQSLRRHNILPGDILIAKVGATIGDCCIYPMNQPEGMLSTTGSCRVRVDKNVISNKFLQYYISFHRNTLKKIASQTAQPFLNMKVLKSFPIVLPSLIEQKIIVDELESKLTFCDNIEETISQSLQQAETLRQSIFKKAFEGKLIYNL